MGLMHVAHRVAVRAERLVDRFRSAPEEPPLFEAYRGYATPHDLILRGRVLTRIRADAPLPEQSKWTNLKQMVSLFMTDEVANVTVRVPGTLAEAQSDEEGYVTIALPRGDRAAGWREVTAMVEGSEDLPVACPVLIPSDEARFGVISDIDDTMMQTGAYSLAKNLWTTFTGSAATRHVFPDSIELIRALSKDADAPIFYVSSSPWNLHAFLENTFKRAELPLGPMFLRDLGISDTQFVTGTHGDHKSAAIDTILEANPDLSFVLIGDTGQHDAEIYLDAIQRHPDRIRAVVLRQPGPGPDDAAEAAMDKIKLTGVPLYSDTDFSGFAEPLLAED